MKVLTFESESNNLDNVCKGQNCDRVFQVEPITYLLCDMRLDAVLNLSQSSYFNKYKI